jgi:hypothetical protein
MKKPRRSFQFRVVAASPAGKDVAKISQHVHQLVTKKEKRSFGQMWQPLGNAIAAPRAPGMPL